MESKKLIGTTALLLTIATGVANAEKTVPIWERAPQEQRDAVYSDHASLGDSAAIIDQYSEKLHPEGRFGFVSRCYGRLSNTGPAEKVVLWALCRDDLKAVDEKQLDVTDKGRVDELKKVGADIEAAAKDDRGIAAILAQADAAKADWKAFEEKNHDALVLYQKLKAGVRSGKSNDKNFDGCWEVTQPAFAKAVRATKFHWDNEGDSAIPGRVAEIIGTNPANYYTVANFGMCAYAAHVTGGQLAGSALLATGGVFGWRTMLISKLLAPTFKPKFTDRSYRWDTGENGTMSDFRRFRDEQDASFAWPGGPMRIQTGVVKKMTKDGDDTLVQFKGTVVEDCIDWKETNKIRTWDTAGQPQYERICLKRGHVEEDAPDDATMGTKLLDGFAVGVGVAFYGWFPEEVYNNKTKKFIAILGVSVKGSPAETPIKE